MGHKTLADKLEQIQREDLGIHFDESLLWEDLSAQLGNDKTVFAERKLMIAACITLLILFFPIVLMIDTKPEQLSQNVQSVENVMLAQQSISSMAGHLNTEKEKEIRKTPLHLIIKKGVEFREASLNDFSAIEMIPIPTLKKEKIKRQLFANQYISVIQASLGTPSIEKEKSVTLRAQLHTSSQPVQLNNQAFKIKLFDKSNQ